MKHMLCIYADTYPSVKVATKKSHADMCMSDLGGLELLQFVTSGRGEI